MSETALLLFEVEAFWHDDRTDVSVVRYIEAPDLRTALTVVPEESIILRVNTLGGLYRTVPRVPHNHPIGEEA